MVLILKSLLGILIIIGLFLFYFIIREYRKFLKTPEYGNESIFLRFGLMLIVVVLNVFLLLLSLFSGWLILSNITIA